MLQNTSLTSDEPVNLLALDGGGIRGVSELLILDEVMRRIQYDLDLAEMPRPCDYFDLIGGTSTGGQERLFPYHKFTLDAAYANKYSLSLIALMLGRLRMTTDEALRAYNSLSEVIFSAKNKKRKGQDGSFKATTLQEKVQEIVVERKLGEFMLDESSDSRKGKAFVCAMPANSMAYPRRFRTYRARANASANCRIWEAARATTAAPTFFKRIAIGEEGHAKEEFIDAGLGCNNPAKQVLEEAKSLFGGDRPVRCLVSIGTGHPGTIGLAKPDAFQNILPADLIQVLKKIATDCESTANELARRFEAVEKFYFRFNVTHGAEGISLEEWNKIGVLTEHTKAYMAGKSKKIDEVVAVLCKRTEVSFTLGNVCGVPQIPNMPNVYWSVPFTRNPQFVGRRAQFDQLETALFAKDSPPKTAIFGLGGMGKTQIALELAYRTRERHPHCSVFWLPAIDVQTLQQAFTNLGRELGVPGIEKDQADAKKLVQRYLSQERAGQWLLIVDNIDDMDIWKSELTDQLPRSQRGWIVYTTRSRKLATEITASNLIEVPEMDDKTAIELLSKLLPRQMVPEYYEDARNLLEQLTFIPLAIVQAASYIKKNGTALSKYLSLLHKQEQQVIELLSEGFEDDSRYRDTKNVKNPVATTWLISFDQIRLHDPLAADYLSFISWVAPKNIPESLLPPGSSPVKQENAIGTLDAYSFITRRAADDAFDVHRLVQLVMRSWLRKEDEWQSWASKALERLVELIPLGGHKEKEVWTTYLPHAIHVVGLTEIDETESRMDLLDRIGRCEQALGRYAVAEWAHRQLLERRIRLFGEADQSTLASMNEVGLALEYQGKYKEAEAMHRRALEGKEKVLGPEHTGTLISADNLGSVLQSQGKYKEAEAMHRRALEGFEKVLGPEHTETLISAGNLGSVLQNQGKYKEAEAMHRRALEGFEKVLGPEHSSTLSSAGNLGLVLRSQGKYKEAEAMHRRALEGFEKVLGPEHSETLISAGNLGLVLQRQGKYKEAEAMHRRALEGKEKVLGPEHTGTLISAGNLGSVLQSQGKYKEAEAMHRRALEGKEKVLGPEHSETLASADNLGSVLQSQGKYKEAEAMHRRALEGKEKVLGPEHSEILTSAGNLGLVLRRQGKYKEAEAMHRRALEGFEKVLGPEHSDTLATMNNLAITFKSQARNEDAITLMDSCYQLRKQILGSFHPDTKSSLETLNEWRMER